MNENKGIGHGWLLFILVLLLLVGVTNSKQNTRIANLEQQVKELRSRR